MPDKSDNPFKFWEELKRRKVVRVVIGYLASSYVLLELTSIIAEPLGLPGWTINLVLLLLLIGFVITVLISWIYDFTSEGLKKTESVKTIKSKEPVSQNGKRKLRVSDIIIAALLITVIILAYPRIFNMDKLKGVRNNEGMITVAVLPFENQTGDTTLNWFESGVSSLIINGLGSSTDIVVYDTRSHTKY